MIDGTTRTCGLIGYPVSHTLSPVIHNNLAEKMGIPLAYVTFLVEPDGLRQAVEGAFALNLLGLNVTVPYKSKVIPYLQEVDPSAARIGAVNTLVRTENGFKGYNTDMPGLYRAMEQDGVQVAGKHAVVLGAGGVARAVVFLLAEKGAKSITILNRSLEKGEQIAAEVTAIYGNDLVKVFPLSMADQLPESSYLVIQATSVGMHPKEEETPLPESTFFDKIEVGYDLIFNPTQTRFMKLVEKHGGRAYNGMKMLLYQGIIAFELWNRVQVADCLAEEIYRLLEA